jgi:hypothetical protein
MVWRSLLNGVRVAQVAGGKAQGGCDLYLDACLGG